VKKLIVVGSGAIGALALSTVLGTGVAAADDYAGQTYADASSAISDAGGTAVVASRVGDKLGQDDCIVTGSWSPSFIRPASDDTVFNAVTDEVRLNLNCNGGYATAAMPGPSLGSTEGKTAKAAADEAAAKAASEEEAALAAVSTPNH
jgi:hypothetical protein